MSNTNNTDQNTSSSLVKYGYHIIQDGGTLDMTTTETLAKRVILAVVIPSGVTATVTGTQAVYDDELAGVLTELSTQSFVGPAEVLLNIQNAVIDSSGGITQVVFDRK
jgi:hypothetical protein